MKRLTVAAAVLSTVFMSAGAFADTDQGEVIITGRVVGTTCQFLDGNNSTTRAPHTASPALPVRNTVCN